MNDAHNPPKPIPEPAAAPTQATNTTDRYLSPSDPGRSAGEKAHADWVGRDHQDDGGTVVAGSRAVEHPTDTIGEAEGDPVGAGNLYDRLAKKDQTPVDEGGSSSLA